MLRQRRLCGCGGGYATAARRLCGGYVAAMRRGGGGYAAAAISHAAARTATAMRRMRDERGGGVYRCSRGRRIIAIE